MKKQYNAKRFRALLAAVLFLAILANLFAINAQDAATESEEDSSEAMEFVIGENDFENENEDESVFSFYSAVGEEEPEIEPKIELKEIAILDEPETDEFEEIEEIENIEEIEEIEDSGLAVESVDESEEETKDIFDETDDADELFESEETVESEESEESVESEPATEEWQEEIEETEETEESAEAETDTEEEDSEESESDEEFETEEEDELEEEEIEQEDETEDEFDAEEEMEEGPANMPDFGNDGFTWNGWYYEYEDTIDLSMTTAPKIGSGYKVTGQGTNAYILPYNKYKAVSNNTLIFDSGADKKIYHIIQTGYFDDTYGIGSPPESPNRYTSIFKAIEIPAGVEVTLVISDIDMEIGTIILSGTGKLNLLLDGANFVRGYIEVPSSAEIYIDSLSGNDSGDILAIPSEASSKGSSHAGIGGAEENDAGTITINGGTINIISRSSGACIGGGGTKIFNSASPASPGGNGGATIIMGGVLNLTQIGPGDDLGTGYGGACIGGGGGNTGNGGDGGTINIAGGTLTIRQQTRAAGIGGGTFGPAGHITISGGNIDAEVIRLASFGTGEGAAIGTASGLNREGAGSILITGGTIRAVSYTTGIGRMHGSDIHSPLSITITGGNIYAKGSIGPGIGYFSHSYGDPITIAGGTIIAKSDISTGIGSDDDIAALYLDAAANVKAYSGGNKPAINTASNQGDGYFVNACLNAVISNSANTPLHVYAENGGAFLKTLELPAGYHHFAYSSDITSSRTDNIFAEIGSDFKSVLRIEDDSPQIYSIITRAGYDAHNLPANANSGSLPVYIDSALYYMITEKYVDINGKSLAPDTKTNIKQSTPEYFKTIPAIDGYKPLGYSIGGNYLPGTYTPGGTVAIDPVTQNFIIYFVYREYALTTLTISKTVTGAYGNKIKEFAFTVTFKDSAGDPLPQGTAFAYAKGSATGTLTLNANGEAEIKLKHGESIVIENVTETYKIQIEEANDNNYNASYADSELGDGDGRDTGEFDMTDSPRSVDFTNERKYAPETGLGLGSIGAMLLLPILAALAVLGWFAAKTLIRRKTGAKPATCS